MKIENYTIGSDYPPFIIAEMSGNHNQSLSRALKIVDAVAQSGAHAIKLQTYKPETITINCKSKDFLISKNSPWKNKTTLWELYKKAHKSQSSEEHPGGYCRERSSYPSLQSDAHLSGM